MRRLASGVLVLTVVFAPGAALASSQPQSGVHVDPGSPAGKQYAFPIGAARTEALGSPPSSGSSGANPPLFGSGILPSGAAGGSVRSGAAGGPSGSGQGGGTGGATGSSRSPLTDVLSSAGLNYTSRDSSAGLAMLGGGVLVLVVGGAGGLALRRRM